MFRPFKVSTSCHFQRFLAFEKHKCLDTLPDYVLEVLIEFLYGSEDDILNGPDNKNPMYSQIWDLSINEGNSKDDEVENLDRMNLADFLFG